MEVEVVLKSWRAHGLERKSKNRIGERLAGAFAVDMVLSLPADNGLAKGLCEFCEKGFVEKSDPFGLKIPP